MDKKKIGPQNRRGRPLKRPRKEDIKKDFKE
jgi:hypothetical protein